MLKLIFYLILSGLLFHVLTLKYTNPYKLTMIFGKKGAGKTTLLTKLSYKHIKRGWTVYSTENIPGTRFIKPEYIGFYYFPDADFKPFNPDDYHGIVKLLKLFRNWIFPYRPKILLLVDEVGLVWNSRDYRDFKKQVRQWFKLQRHYCTKVYMFSQSFDVDKQLRDLTDQMYLIANVFRIFSWGKRILKKPTLKENKEDGSGTIVDDLRFDSIFFFMFGSRILTYVPRWTKMFNSFVVPELPVCKFEEVSWNYDDYVPKSERKRSKRKSDSESEPDAASEPQHYDYEMTEDDLFMLDLLPDDFEPLPIYPDAHLPEESDENLP